MSCTPEDLLTLAEALADSEPCGEAQRRCAISRAYYSLFHVVDKLFEKINGDARVGGESSHAHTIRRVRSYSMISDAGRESAARLAKAMVRLKDERNQADYHLDEKIEMRDVQDVIQRVRYAHSLCVDIERRRQVVAANQRLE